MMREFIEAFEEARPYLQKPQQAIQILEGIKSIEELERKIEEFSEKDKILATDLKIILGYLRRC